VTVTEQSTDTSLRELHDGTWYPADEVAKGAAYELFADQPADGFLPNPRRGARYPYRRFVHVTDVLAVTGVSSTVAAARATGEQPVLEAPEQPLRMPVSRVWDWTALHRLSQRPAAGDSPTAAIRRSATVRRGIRMVKVLSGRQVLGYLRGWLPSGFCYREYDVAHLRTPADLGVLRGDGGEPGDVVFALRWRAVDPVDYAVPLADAYPGLVRMPPHDRLGPPVIRADGEWLRLRVCRSTAERVSALSAHCVERGLYERLRQRSAGAVKLRPLRRSAPRDQQAGARSASRLWS